MEMLEMKNCAFVYFGLFTMAMKVTVLTSDLVTTIVPKEIGQKRKRGREESNRERKRDKEVDAKILIT